MLGRRLPSEKEPNPQVFKMQLFATDAVRARSRFWYFLSKLRKVKRRNGEIVAVHEVYEKRPTTVKNFGVWIRYDSRSGTHNMYKEYRGTTLCGAIEQMYSELAGRHRVRKSCIQIVKTARLTASQCKRPNTLQFHTDKIKFPMPDSTLPHPHHKHYRKTFESNRPNHSRF